MVEVGKRKWRVACFRSHTTVSPASSTIEKAFSCLNFLPHVTMPPAAFSHVPYERVCLLLFLIGSVCQRGSHPHEREKVREEGYLTEVRGRRRQRGKVQYRGGSLTASPGQAMGTRLRLE